MPLKLTAITRTEARAFIARHHRHSKPPSVAVIQVGVSNGESLVGVGMAGRPLSRLLCDGRTLEILRICSDGTQNVCSMLYGALVRAGKSLGYTRFLTYTLESEIGTSLRASGWKEDGVRSHDSQGWQKQKESGRSQSRMQVRNLFGEVTVPHGPKRRWVLEVNP
jgi:hypothetical protein